VTEQRPVVEMHGVDFSYGGAPVLQDIALQVHAGEFLGIVGPNAGGKSTLLQIILGLLVPQAGRVAVLGTRPDLAARRIGYVPQYPKFSRDFPISVEQVVQLGRVAHRRKRRFGFGMWLPVFRQHGDCCLATQALAEVEADDLARRQIGSLSGGQLQRVLLARALVGEPEMLILDEPTANIDQRVESEIFDLLARLNEQMTILVVSHDVAFISRYVRRVACVNRTLVCHRTDAINGRLIADLYGEDVRMVAHHH